MQLQWHKLLRAASDVTAQVQVQSPDAPKNTPVSLRGSLAIFPRITSAAQIGALEWNSHLTNTTTPPLPALPPKRSIFPQTSNALRQKINNYEPKF